MDHITEAFYNVMYQYRLAFTPDGVQANLDLWRQQKTPLLELLRRHPNWREQELAVVFDLSEQRQLDRACVDETKFEMLTLAEEAGLTGERLEEFRDALDAATADYATVPDESRLPVIRNRGHIKCDAGMKASRIINRLCAKFGIDQYETERSLDTGIRSIPHESSPTTRFSRGWLTRSIRCGSAKPAYCPSIRATFWRCQRRKTHGIPVTV